MKTLVIGGCGFIGSHLVDHLLEQGHSVHVVDFCPERYRDPNRRIKYHFFNYADPVKLDALLGYGFESICHLASSTTPFTSNIDPSRDVNDNVLGALTLLEAAVKHQVAHMIFFSSGGTVYGNHTKPVLSECDLERPISSYGISKLAIEHYFRLYYELHGLNYTILRVSNPFGPHQNPESSQGVVSIFLNHLLSGEKLVIYGDGSNIRDYVCVSDVVLACSKALQERKVGTFNIARGVGLSLKDLVLILSERTGISPNVEYLPARKFDVKSIVLDNSKARSELNWSPSVDFSSQIDSTIDWVRFWQKSFKTA